MGFTGKFAMPGYDESRYARALADERGFELHEVEIGPDDFVDADRGGRLPPRLPGRRARARSRSTWSRSSPAKHRKVVLGGQGGDEIFGGYVRYLIAYFEQCIKGAIEGRCTPATSSSPTSRSSRTSARCASTSRCCSEFWRDGLFDDLDARYFRLINRAPDLGDEINWDAARRVLAVRDLQGRSSTARTSSKESYFDSMTHFDFKTLLPALLQVEDRVSMAHGLESRVPLLDHPLVELAATMPADVKFKDGHLKHVLKTAFAQVLPDGDPRPTRQDGLPGAAAGVDRARPGPCASSWSTRSRREAAREPRARRQPPRSSSGSTRSRASAARSGACCPSSSGSRRSTTAAHSRSDTRTAEALV